MNAAELAAVLSGATRRNDHWWEARCPAHDDQKPSLNFRDGDQGLILKCHAGCTRRQILAAVERKNPHLASSRDRTSPSAPSNLVATYPYRDGNGTLLYEVVRYEPKGFRQRQPDDQGGWIWHIQGVRRVLYRLPELQTLARGYVLILEGEKDVDRLRDLGWPATTNPEGAGKWKEDYTQQLIALGT